MATRESMVSLMYLVSRAPSLPLLDAWWRSPGPPFEVTELICKERSVDTSWCTDQMDSLVWILYYAVIPLLSVVLLIIKREWIAIFYSMVFNISLILLSNALSANFISSLSSEEISESGSDAIKPTYLSWHATKYHVIHLVIHICIATTIGYRLNLRNRWLNILLLYYALPNFTYLVGISPNYLVYYHAAPYFVAFKLPIGIVLLIYNYLLYPLLCCILVVIKGVFLVSMLIVLGTMFLLFGPALSVSWLALVGLRFLQNGFQEGFSIEIQVASMSEICSSVFAFIGLCATVDILSRGLWLVAKLYLQCPEVPNFLGFMTAMTMTNCVLANAIYGRPFAQHVSLPFYMAFQVSVIYFWALSTLTTSVLFTLSTSQNKCIGKHVRALTVGLFLILVPLYFLFLCYNRNDFGAWVFVLTTISTVHCLDVMAQLAMYIVRMWDTFSERHPWCNVDDALHVIQWINTGLVAASTILSAASTVWILFTDEECVFALICWMVTNASQILERCSIQYKAYRRRKEIRNLVEQLPIATDYEIHVYDDVCAICQQSMESAKFAACSHLFHGDCLFKCVLGNNSRCPLCQKDIFKLEATDLNESFRNWMAKLKLNRPTLRTNNKMD